MRDLIIIAFLFFSISCTVNAQFACPDDPDFFHDARQNQNLWAVQWICFSLNRAQRTWLPVLRSVFSIISDPEFFSLSAAPLSPLLILFLFPQLSLRLSGSYRVSLFFSLTWNVEVTQSSTQPWSPRLLSVHLFFWILPFFFVFSGALQLRLEQEGEAQFGSQRCGLHPQVQPGESSSSGLILLHLREEGEREVASWCKKSPPAFLPWSIKLLNHRAASLLSCPEVVASLVRPLSNHPLSDWCVL